MVQKCAVAKAKSDFIIVPYDDDLKYLLDDLDKFGAQKIAGMLAILAYARYPTTSKAWEAVAQRYALQRKHKLYI